MTAVGDSFSAKTIDFPSYQPYIVHLSHEAVTLRTDQEKNCDRDHKYPHKSLVKQSRDSYVKTTSIDKKEQ